MSGDEFNTLTFFHFSDLHLTKSRLTDQKIVLKAFLDDVELISDKYGAPDLLFFSGDLVNNPDEADIYDLALEQFLFPLFDRTKFDYERFFVVPGNHDVHRSAVESQKNSLNQSIKQLKSRDSLNYFYEQNTQSKEVRARSAEYWNFRNQFTYGSLVFSNYFVEVFVIQDKNLSILCLNTSWSSRAGTSDDYGQLLFPEAAINHALAHVPENMTVVVMGHHPFEWLNENSSQDLKTILFQRAHFYLCGHLHMQQPQVVIAPSGQLMHAQAGAIFDSRDRFNGYSLIRYEIEKGHLEINLRSYFDSRRAFDQATDVCKDGRYHFTPAAREFWTRERNRPSIKIFTQWLREQVWPGIRDNLDSGLSDHPTSELFVPPRLSDEPPHGVNARDDSQDPSEIKFREFCTSLENFLVVARPEYGKSTLLRQTALYYLDPASGAPHPRLPLILEFEELKPGREVILRAFRSFLPDLAWVDFNLKGLLSEGLCVVLLDDFRPSDRERTEILFSFVRQYPLNRYIFTANEESDLLSGIIPTIRAEAPVPLKVVHLLQPSRHEIRQLVKKWPNQPIEGVDRVLDRLFSTIIYINVPVTAVNATILLSIFDADADFKPINQAVLVERFIELLLEKGNLSDALRGNFDFRLKEHFLSSLAYEMVQTDSYRKSYASVISFADGYLTRHGFSGDSRALIEGFCFSKVLVIQNDEVSFRYRAFLEFFIAKRIEDDENFRALVLSEERYLQFVNEIEYYAALRRDSLGLLESLRERFLRLDERLGAAVEWERSLDKLDHLTLPRVYDTADVLYSEIEAEIEAPRSTEEDRDSLLEGEIPRDIGERQEVYRPLYSDLGQEWMACLTLYSGVLRNCELIEDGAKREHLSTVLHGWAMLLMHSFFLVPSLVKHRHFRANGVSYHVDFPAEMKEVDVALRIYLSLPRAISELVKVFLGSEKLENQLGSDDLNQSNENLTIRFLRRALYSDLKLPGHVRYLGELEIQLRESEYWYKALVWRNKEYLRRASLDAGEYKKIQALVSHMVGRIAPGDRKDKQRARSDEMRRLTKRRMLEQLRLTALRIRND